MVFAIEKISKYIMTDIITDLGEEEAEQNNKANKNDNAPKRKGFDE